MTETNTGRPEAQQPKTNVIDFEAARQKRQAEQKPQIRRTLTPPPTQADRQERHAEKRQQRIKDDLAHTTPQPTDRKAQQQAGRTQEDDTLVNEMLGGQTEEQIAAHNEQVKARRVKDQAEKEKVRQEALGHYIKYQEHLAAMTPEEREAQKKSREEMRKGFAYSQTPEGRMESAAHMARWMKSLGILPPNIDHLWLNLPSGWVEYREAAGGAGSKEPSYTVILGTEPTQEQWNEYYPDLQAKMRAWKTEKAKREHAGDPRYDPLTGDLLEPDEFPLSPTSEYYFDGKTRGRRFIPPDSPHLKNYKPLRIDEERVPESEYHERLAQRLQKAGFVEVEPTLADKASFEQTQWYRSLSPTEKMHYLQEAMQEMTGGKPWNKETAGGTAGEKFAKFIALLIDFLIALISPEVATEMQKKESSQMAS
jgi:hypothetical protein